MGSKIYDISLESSTGAEQTLKKYEGKVMLIVNVASKCGFTPQYAGLEKLNEQYRNRGLNILAIPSNDFGGQEPGTMEEIEQFCSINYGVTFDILGKVHAIGEEQHPIYKWLTDNADSHEDVKWNFEKFLISKDGKVLHRYPSKVSPDDPELISNIEEAL